MTLQQNPIPAIATKMDVLAGLPTVALSVGGWFFDRVGVSAIDCPYPCDNTCHNLVSKIRWHAVIRFSSQSRSCNLIGKEASCNSRNATHHGRPESFVQAFDPFRCQYRSKSID
ncbi:hypothetical protein Scep_026801 [Stephania cephalantha]|uniref:Pectin acetylesterase n=1 Tax=Stephania cephalantha TaxID=152367 RepID=A0AAP0EP15_9MAGN